MGTARRLRGAADLDRFRKQGGPVTAAPSLARAAHKGIAGATMPKEPALSLRTAPGRRRAWRSCHYFPVHRP